MTAGQRYLEAWASIGSFQTSKVREGSGRFCRCFEGSRDIFKQKKLWAFGKVFCLRFPSRFPVCPEGFRFGGTVDESCPWDDIPWHPHPNGKSLGFPQQARRIWDGRSGLPNLGWMDPRQRPMSMFKISILEFWNEYKVELLICFFHVRSLFGQIVGCKRFEVQQAKYNL